jgi:hypothetical protein
MVAFVVIWITCHKYERKCEWETEMYKIHKHSILLQTQEMSDLNNPLVPHYKACELTLEQINKWNLISEISGSHGGEYEVQSLLGCSAM